MDKQSRINELSQKITAWKIAYYKGKPLVTDAVYDAHESELRKLNPNDPALDVGTPDVGKSKYTHKVAMLSLQKVNTAAALRSWGEKRGVQLLYVISPKLDGFAISLHYSESGEWEMSVVRGRGKFGDIVSHVINPDTIPSIPRTLGKKKEIEKDLDGHKCEIRGELVIYKDDFVKVNEERVRLGKPLFKNTRNAAASACNVKTDWEVKYRRLRFIAYKLIIH